MKILILNGPNLNLLGKASQKSTGVSPLRSISCNSASVFRNTRFPISRPTTRA